MEKVKENIEKAKDTWAKVESMYNNKTLVKKLSVMFFFLGIALYVFSMFMADIGFLGTVLKGMAYGFIIVFMVGYLIMHFVHGEDLLDTIFGMFSKDKKKGVK